MLCSNPCFVVPTGGLTASGQPEYKFVSGRESVRGVFNAIQVPCGRCDLCRINHASEWANRLSVERQKHDFCYFVTLTYDDGAIPFEFIVDKESGEVFSVGNLCPDDVTKFIKRLRKSFKLSYFYCGEYGGKTFRPHYHLILFMNQSIDDLKYFSGKGDNTLYTSAILSKKWSLGHVLIGNASVGAFEYVARYTLKKSPYTRDNEFVKPEFIRMSKGLGLPDDLSSVYKTDRVYINGRSFKPPRYYDKVYERSDPDDLFLIKQSRKIVGGLTQNALEKHLGRNFDDYVQDVLNSFVIKRKKIRSDP